jgi:hypothetical protein
VSVYSCNNGLIFKDGVLIYENAILEALNNPPALTLEAFDAMTLKFKLARNGCIRDLQVLHELRCDLFGDQIAKDARRIQYAKLKLEFET